MALRPVFRPNPKRPPYFDVVRVEFEWHPGFSLTQAQRSVESLHLAAADLGISPILEISSKSRAPLGVQLSAFNLCITELVVTLPVECAFQGSKVFRDGGPFTDLYGASPRDAKRDPRLTSSGPLIGFHFEGVRFPLQPVTAFYDWLYLRALAQNTRLAGQLAQYAGFTDIAFNPERSWNCQAQSAAQYVALVDRHVDVGALVADKDRYLDYMTGIVPHADAQVNQPMSGRSMGSEQLQLGLDGIAPNSAQNSVSGKATAKKGKRAT